MNELEVRFELNDEKDYNNAISYLEKEENLKVMRQVALSTEFAKKMIIEQVFSQEKIR